MTLTDDQKASVSEWLKEGLKLSDVQKRLETQFGLRLTYIEVRFLVDDLKLVPKDHSVPQTVTLPMPPPPSSLGVPPGPSVPAAGEPHGGSAPAQEAGLGGGTVSLTVDQVTRPGSMVSGTVTFSDGQKAVWNMDQTGRLGLSAAQKGYRPPQEDLAQFQIALEQELVKLGM